MGARGASPEGLGSLVAACDRKYDLSVQVVLAAMRERFHSILLESKRGKFGASFYMNIDPVVAQRVLHALAARRSGASLELEHFESEEQVQTVLELNEQTDIANVVLLHAAHPEHGLGNLRIRHGCLRDKDVLAFQMLVFELSQPKPVGARELLDGHVFKVTYTTLKFNGATGEHLQPEGCVLISDEKTGKTIRDTRLTDAQRDPVVEHVKRLIQEPYATAACFKGSWRVKRHRLSENWAKLLFSPQCFSLAPRASLVCNNSMGYGFAPPG